MKDYIQNESTSSTSRAGSVLFLCHVSRDAGGPSGLRCPAGPLTLEQVLALAEARSEAIGISRAGVQRAEGEQRAPAADSFPQLSASASYDRALASEFLRHF